MTLRISEYNTVEEAYFGLSHELVNNPTWPDGYRGTHNLRLFSFDHILTVKYPKSTLNLATVGFQPNRWYKMFLSQYLDQQSFVDFLSFLKARKGRDAQSYAYTCPTRARHSLNNCLIGFTVRTGKHPRVALYSRSCYFQPTGILDLSLGAVLCEYVATITKQPYCELVWYINHLQSNGWKLLPYILNIDHTPDSFIPDSPGLNPWQVMFKDKMQKAYEHHVNGTNPNSRYMLYARYLKKMQAIADRKAAGLELPHYGMVLPAEYLPQDYGAPSISDLTLAVVDEDYPDEGEDDD